MNKTNFFLFLALTFVLSFYSFSSPAQIYSSDSTQNLKAVSVRAYLQEQPLFRLTTSVGHLDSLQLNRHDQTSLLPSLNTIPGVRMEERSPGSYRLSVRGSLLRSPFGVRNVKVYYDEIPLTDAGGNTYLNLIDAASISEINVLKGPDGSLFGANSGGVVLLSPYGTGKHTDEAKASVTAGSYGLFQEQVGVRYQPTDDYRFSFNHAYVSADGYRENSAMSRHFLQTVHRYYYTPRNEIRLLGFYSDMHYMTPGGLNQEQYEEDPTSARQAAGPNPGAAEQRAGIYNKTLFGGLVHDSKISNRLKHVLSVFGTYTDFENPFITNYEFRIEKNYGFRTYLSFQNKPRTDLSWTVSAGVEWQKNHANIKNYDNNGGIQGAEQSGDAFRSGQYFYFARFTADWKKRLFLELANSLNYYHYSFRGLYPDGEADFSKIDFQGEWMPRLALSYVLNKELSWRASVGRGYSPPTTAEVRPSDRIINTDLVAETGWNYETGLRWYNQWVQADLGVFYYKMEDGLVRQSRENGAEYFLNAGSVKQRGLELAVNSTVWETDHERFLRAIQLGTNITLSKFNFGEYVNGGNDYSGNKLTGVPSTIVVNNIYTKLPKNLSLNIQHTYTSSIPLNDANDVFSESFNLLRAKIDYTTKISNAGLNLFFSADNILNEKYSLGNDINAYGGRYFNAAPLVNFSFGAKVEI